MSQVASRGASTAHIEYLRVQNFRALQDVKLKNVPPLTVLLGPNGSGKSTVFDVFVFLKDCFDSGPRGAWCERGRAKELRTRGTERLVTIEIKYRERPKTPLIAYHMAVNEPNGRPAVIHEWLSWKRGRYGRTFRFLEYRKRYGQAARSDAPDVDDAHVETPLKSPDILAVNALGQFQEYPRVAALRNFIIGWHVAYLSADGTRGQPEARPQKQLNKAGDNLVNVIQYLSEKYSENVERIFKVLRHRMRRVEHVLAETILDSLQLLQIKDAPFNNPVLVRLASDGTLKMLAYLVLLHGPKPSPFIGIEELKNFLYPRLLSELAEECRATCEPTQLLVTTHSPSFLDAEIRVLWRDDAGHTQARYAAELLGAHDLTYEGNLLGHLWMEGQFGIGDPLVAQGGPTRDVKGSAR